MSDINAPKAGALFWGLGGLFVIWNLFGCAGYLMEVTMSNEDYSELYGEAMAAVRDKYPTWSMAAYAVAVWGGFLGAMLYLLRKKVAVTLFIVSLVAAVISFYWGLTNEEARAATDDSAWIMPVLVFGIGVIEIWWSRKKVTEGVLR